MPVSIADGLEWQRLSAGCTPAQTHTLPQAIAGMEKDCSKCKKDSKVPFSQSVEQQPVGIGALQHSYKHIIAINYESFVIFLWVTPLQCTEKVRVNSHR